MSRKLLFFDIDGTLITDDANRHFPESAKRAIKKARDNGNLCFINTGRVALNVEAFILEAGFDGLVCGCGTYISHGEEVLLRNRLTNEQCREIALLLRECKVFGLFESTEMNTIDKDAYVPDSVKELLAYFMQMQRGINDDVLSDDFYFDKFTAWFEEDADIERFKEGIKDTFDYIDRGVGMCEIVPKGFSKASGIQFLMDYYDVPLEDVYAFGDSNNDLPMLDFVIHSVGMEESSQKVLENVSFVTRKVEENGIEYALQHFGIID